MCLLLLLGVAGASVGADAIALRMTRAAPSSARTWHFRTGVPFAKGALSDASGAALTREGRPVPAQTEVLARWGPPGSALGNSIRWLGLDFVDSVAAGKRNEYRLILGKRGKAQGPVTVERSDKGLRVTNGRFEIELPASGAGFDLLGSVKLDGKSVIARGACPGAFIADGKGRTYWARLDATCAITVEQAGPLAATIRAEGWFVDPKAPPSAAPKGEPAPRPKGGFCRYVTRLTVAAGLPCVRVQHTFILTEDSKKTTYRDIGIALPFAGTHGGTSFGAAPGSFPGHVYLLQSSDEKFVVKSAAGDGKTLAEGERAEGWARAGGLGVAVRDMWRNYPKEIEVLPDRRRLIIHFWPKHGVPRHETAETVTGANGWRLPFVHTGEKLDFSIPPVFLDKKIFGREYGYLGSHQSVEEGMEANALGVAKTHELLIDFGGEGFLARQALFRSAAHALPDPAHIARTAVLGHVAESDVAAFPMFEARVVRGMKFYLRMLRRVGSYGMWNYGDVHHKWHKRRVGRDMVWRPQYYRLWAGFHHGYARLPWWLYMRTGDPEFLDFGRAQCLHTGDIDLCHWSNAESAKGKPNRNRKMVGGLCDYKGFVHWNAGDRGGYNSMIDHFLYDFYLTGNRRSRDVALEHGYYVLKHMGVSHGRGGAGIADTIINLYKATWDPKVEARMHRACASMMARAPDKQHAPWWTPWLTRYWQLTSSPKAKKYLLDWVASGHFVHDGLDKVSEAWFVTGDLKYAKRCAERLQYRGALTYLRDGDLLDGWTGSGWYEWAFQAREAMMATQAARAGLPHLALADLETHPVRALTARYEKDYVARQWKLPYNWRDKRQRVVAALYHDGAAKTIPLGTGFQYKSSESLLYGPDGKPIKRFALEGRRNRGGSEKVGLGPDDPKGFYYMVFFSPFSFRPIIPDLEKIWVRAGRDGMFTQRRGRVFFYVPEDCARFEMTFVGGESVTGSRHLARGALFNPDLKPVARLSVGHDRKPLVVKIEVPPAHRGKPWYLIGEEYLTLVDVKGVPPWMAGTYKAFEGAPRFPPDKMPIRR